MGIEAPTPEQVAAAEATRNDGLSSYLDDEQKLHAELRRADAEGRKPNIKDFNEVTIKAVAPQLLKGYKEPELEEPFNQEKHLSEVGGGNEYVEGEIPPVQEPPVNEEDTIPEQQNNEPEDSILTNPITEIKSEETEVKSEETEVKSEEPIEVKPATKPKAKKTTQAKPTTKPQAK